MKRSTQSDFDFFYPPDTYIDAETGAIGIRDTTTGTVTRGEQFLLNDYSMKAVLTSGGYGMPDMKWMEQTGPFQHGNTLLDYRLMPRTISLEFIQTSTSLAQYWTDRAKLLDIFRISRQPRAGVLGLARLRKILPDNSKRDIYVTFYGGMKFDFGGDASDFRSPTNSIELYAPDPTFFDPVQNIEAIVLAATTELAFPKTIKGWGYCTANVLIGDLSIAYYDYGTPNNSASRLTATTTAIVAGDILIIGTEKITVTAVTITTPNTGTLTVTRASCGTVAAAHTLADLIAVTKDTTTVANFAITASTYEPWKVVYDFYTTLSATISAAATTIDYASMLGLAGGAAVGDVLYCGTEKMLVTAAVSSTQATVIRGHEATTAAIHTSGAVLVITAAAQIAQNPNALGITFGSATLAESFVINYAGTWNSFPVLEVTGPWDNFTITNAATLETLDFGYNIDGGETVTFDLSYGVKTVLNQNGTNLIGSLSTDSDLATFHLTPDAEVTANTANDGLNPISVTGTNLNEDSALMLKWYTRYIGI